MAPQIPMNCLPTVNQTNTKDSTAMSAVER